MFNLNLIKGKNRLHATRNDTIKVKAVKDNSFIKDF